MAGTKEINKNIKLFEGNKVRRVWHDELYEKIVQLNKTVTKCNSLDSQELFSRRGYGQIVHTLSKGWVQIVHTLSKGWVQIVHILEKELREVFYKREGSNCHPPYLKGGTNCTPVISRFF